MDPSSTAPSSVAFLPADPSILAGKTRETLFTSSGNSSLEDIDHLVGRLESVVADWITMGQIDKLAEWVKGVEGSARQAKMELADRHGLKVAELQSLRAVFLSEFVQRFAGTDSLAKAVSSLLAPKRANWRRALALMAGSDRPWSNKDFKELVGLKRSATHDAIAALTLQGLLLQTDSGHGKKSYELTPYGRRVAFRLGKQELVSDHGHGDVETRVPRLEIEIKSSAKKGPALPEGVMRYNLPNDVISLLFNDNWLQSSAPSGRLWASSPQYYGGSLRSTVWHEEAPYVREQSYSRFFEDTLQCWIRDKREISSAVEQYSRRQLISWLPSNPLAILNTYHPLLIAAKSPSVFRKMVTLIRSQRKMKPERSMDHFCILWSSFSPSGKLELAPEFLSQFSSNHAEITNTLCFKYLPVVAKIMVQRKMIRVSELTDLENYWRVLLRSVYPRDYEVLVNLLSLDENPKPETNRSVHVSYASPIPSGMNELTQKCQVRLGDGSGVASPVGQGTGRRMDQPAPSVGVIRERLFQTGSVKRNLGTQQPSLSKA